MTKLYQQLQGGPSKGPTSQQYGDRTYYVTEGGVHFGDEERIIEAQHREQAAINSKDLISEIQSGAPLWGVDLAGYAGVFQRTLGMSKGDASQLVSQLDGTLKKNRGER